MARYSALDGHQDTPATKPQQNHWKRLGDDRSVPQATPREDWGPGHLANTFVPTTAPFYHAIKDRCEKEADYLWRAEGHGVWVPVQWVWDLGGHGR